MEHQVAINSKSDTQHCKISQNEQSNEIREKNLISQFNISISRSINNLNLNEKQSDIVKEKLRIPFIIGTEEFFNSDNLGIKEIVIENNISNKPEVALQQKPEEKQNSSSKIQHHSELIMEEEEEEEEEQNFIGKNNLLSNFLLKKKPNLFDEYEDKTDRKSEEKKEPIYKKDKLIDNNYKEKGKKIQISLDNFIKNKLFDSDIEENSDNDLGVLLKSKLIVSNDKKEEAVSNVNIKDQKIENSIVKEDQNLKKAKAILFKMFDEEDENEEEEEEFQLEKEEEHIKKKEETTKTIQMKTKDFSQKLNDLLRDKICENKETVITKENNQNSIKEESKISISLSNEIPIIQKNKPKKPNFSLTVNEKSDVPKEKQKSKGIIKFFEEDD